MPANAGANSVNALSDVNRHAVEIAQNVYANLVRQSPQRGFAKFQARYAFGRLFCHERRMAVMFDCRWMAPLRTMVVERTVSASAWATAMVTELMSRSSALKHRANASSISTWSSVCGGGLGLFLGLGMVAGSR